MKGEGYPGAGIVVAGAEDDEADADADEELAIGNEDEAIELVAMLITGCGSPRGIFQYVLRRS